MTKISDQKKLRDYAAGEDISGFFALRECSLATAKNGKPYLRLTVGDAESSLDGNMWDIMPKLATTLVAGAVVKIAGGVETYRDKLQLRVEKLRIAGAEEFKPEDFLRHSNCVIADLEKELDDAIGAVGDPDYQQLLQNFFGDAAFRQQFRRAPAAKSNHHAWLGGLLEHTVEMLRYGRVLLAQMPHRLNADLLLTGIILHDVGKIDEFAIGATIEYSDVGRLIGHIVIGAMMVAERSAPTMPPLKKQLLQHLLLSHHGQLEFGSPVLPLLPEAFALHHLDNLDAKIIATTNWITEDQTPGNWTMKSYMFNASLFKIPAPLFGGAAENRAAPTPKNAGLFGG
jgi:3'-5' exoribonuclease